MTFFEVIGYIFTVSTGFISIWSTCHCFYKYTNIFLARGMEGLFYANISS